MDTENDNTETCSPADVITRILQSEGKQSPPFGDKEKAFLNGAVGYFIANRDVFKAFSQVVDGVILGELKPIAEH
uniref:Uncharacterized protein n=1 Tax=mine drainage metagenome TaxID=410659 RepID=E6QLU5_9ZZZZ